MTREQAERILRTAWTAYVGDDRTFYTGVLEFDWGTTQVTRAAEAMVAAYEIGYRDGEASKP